VQAARASSPVVRWRGHLFPAAMLTITALFTGFILVILLADVRYVSLGVVKEVLRSPEILAALWLSVWTSATTVVLGLVFAIPIGYALSRYRFLGHAVVDSIVDLPILLPPLIVGLSLLVFFQTGIGKWIESNGVKFVYQRKGIVLCQFVVSASFGIRAIKLTFDGIDRRLEHVAMTLGCGRAQAFFRVALPMARRGILAGGLLIWVRALGIFGPLLIFVGAVRRRTEVLPTTIYLEQSIGRIESALAVAVVMLVLATLALVLIRMVAKEGHDQG